MSGQSLRRDSRGLTSPAPGGACWLLSKVRPRGQRTSGPEALAYAFLLLSASLLLSFLLVVP